MGGKSDGSGGGGGGAGGGGQRRKNGAKKFLEKLTNATSATIPVSTVLTVGSTPRLLASPTNRSGEITFKDSSNFASSSGEKVSTMQTTTTTTSTPPLDYMEVFQQKIDVLTGKRAPDEDDETFKMWKRRQDHKQKIENAFAKLDELVKNHETMMFEMDIQQKNMIADIRLGERGKNHGNERENEADKHMRSTSDDARQLLYDLSLMERAELPRAKELDKVFQFLLTNLSKAPTQRERLVEIENVLIGDGKKKVNVLTAMSAAISQLQVEHSELQKHAEEDMAKFQIMAERAYAADLQISTAHEQLSSTRSELTRREREHAEEVSRLLDKISQNDVHHELELAAVIADLEKSREKLAAATAEIKEMKARLEEAAKSKQRLAQLEAEHASSASRFATLQQEIQQAKQDLIAERKAKAEIETQSAHWEQILRDRVDEKDKQLAQMKGKIEELQKSKFAAAAAATAAAAELSRRRAAAAAAMAAGPSASDIAADLQSAQKLIFDTNAAADARIRVEIERALKAEAEIERLQSQLDAVSGAGSSSRTHSRPESSGSVGMIVGPSTVMGGWASMSSAVISGGVAIGGGNGSSSGGNNSIAIQTDPLMTSTEEEMDSSADGDFEGGVDGGEADSPRILRRRGGKMVDAIVQTDDGSDANVSSSSSPYYFPPTAANNASHGEGGGFTSSAPHPANALAIEAAVKAARMEARTALMEAEKTVAMLYEQFKSLQSLYDTTVRKNTLQEAQQRDILQGLLDQLDRVEDFHQEELAKKDEKLQWAAATNTRLRTWIKRILIMIGNVAPTSNVQHHIIGIDPDMEEELEANEARFVVHPPPALPFSYNNNGINGDNDKQNNNRGGPRTFADLIVGPGQRKKLAEFFEGIVVEEDDKGASSSFGDDGEGEQRYWMKKLQQQQQEQVAQPPPPTWKDVAGPILELVLRLAEKASVGPRKGSFAERMRQVCCFGVRAPSVRDPYHRSNQRVSHWVLDAVGTFDEMGAGAVAVANENGDSVRTPRGDDGEGAGDDKVGELVSAAAVGGSPKKFGKGRDFLLMRRSSVRNFHAEPPRTAKYQQRVFQAICARAFQAWVEAVAEARAPTNYLARADNLLTHLALASETEKQALSLSRKVRDTIEQQKWRFDAAMEGYVEIAQGEMRPDLAEWVKSHDDDDLASSTGIRGGEEERGGKEEKTTTSTINNNSHNPSVDKTTAATENQLLHSVLNIDQGHNKCKAALQHLARDYRQRENELRLSLQEAENAIVECRQHRQRALEESSQLREELDFVGEQLAEAYEEVAEARFVTNLLKGIIANQQSRMKLEFSSLRRMLFEARAECTQRRERELHLRAEIEDTVASLTKPGAGARRARVVDRASSSSNNNAHSSPPIVEAGKVPFIGSAYSMPPPALTLPAFTGGGGGGGGGTTHRSSTPPRSSPSQNRNTSSSPPPAANRKASNSPPIASSTTPAVAVPSSSFPTSSASPFVAIAGDGTISGHGWQEIQELIHRATSISTALLHHDPRCSQRLRHLFQSLHVSVDAIVGKQWTALRPANPPPFATADVQTDLTIPQGDGGDVNLELLTAYVHVTTQSEKMVSSADKFRKMEAENAILRRMEGHFRVHLADLKKQWVDMKTERDDARRDVEHLMKEIQKTQEHSVMLAEALVMPKARRAQQARRLVRYGMALTTSSRPGTAGSMGGNNNYDSTSSAAAGLSPASNSSATSLVGLLPSARRSLSSRDSFSSSFTTTVGRPPSSRGGGGVMSIGPRTAVDTPRVSLMPSSANSVGGRGGGGREDDRRHFSRDDQEEEEEETGAASNANKNSNTMHLVETILQRREEEERKEYSETMPLEVVTIAVGDGAAAARKAGADRKSDHSLTPEKNVSTSSTPNDMVSIVGNLISTVGDFPPPRKSASPPRTSSPAHQRSRNSSSESMRNEDKVLKQQQKEMKGRPEEQIWETPPKMSVAVVSGNNGNLLMGGVPLPTILKHRLISDGILRPATESLAVNEWLDVMQTYWTKFTLKEQTYMAESTANSLGQAWVGWRAAEAEAVVLRTQQLELVDEVERLKDVVKTMATEPVNIGPPTATIGGGGRRASGASNRKLSVRVPEPPASSNIVTVTQTNDVKVAVKAVVASSKKVEKETNDSRKKSLALHGWISTEQNQQQQPQKEVSASGSYFSDSTTTPPTTSTPTTTTPPSTFSGAAAALATITAAAAVAASPTTIATTAAAATTPIVDLRSREVTLQNAIRRHKATQGQQQQHRHHSLQYPDHFHRSREGSETAIARLEDQVIKLHEQIEKMREVLEEKDETISALRDQLRDVTAEMGRLERRAKKWQARVDEARDQLEEANSHRERVVSDCREQVRRAQEVRDEALQRDHDSRFKIAQHFAEITRLQQRCKGAEIRAEEAMEKMKQSVAAQLKEMALALKASEDVANVAIAVARVAQRQLAFLGVHTSNASPRVAQSTIASLTPTAAALHLEGDKLADAVRHQQEFLPATMNKLKTITGGINAKLGSEVEGGRLLPPLIGVKRHDPFSLESDDDFEMLSLSARSGKRGKGSKIQSWRHVHLSPRAKINALKGQRGDDAGNEDNENDSDDETFFRTEDQRSTPSYSRDPFSFSLWEREETSITWHPVSHSSLDDLAAEMLPQSTIKNHGKDEKPSKNQVKKRQQRIDSEFADLNENITSSLLPNNNNVVTVENTEVAIAPPPPPSLLTSSSPTMNRISPRRSVAALETPSTLPSSSFLNNNQHIDSGPPPLPPTIRSAMPSPRTMNLANSSSHEPQMSLSGTILLKKSPYPPLPPSDNNSSVGVAASIKIADNVEGGDTLMMPQYQPLSSAPPNPSKPKTKKSAPSFRGWTPSPRKTSAGQPVQKMQNL